MKNWAIFFVIISMFFSTDLLAQTNGRNVKIVNYRNGSFKQSGNGTWTEYTSQNRELKFKETARDDWSVYLIDDNRNLTIQLDLFKKEIYINWNGPKRKKLYNIISASNKQLPVKKTTTAIATNKKKAAAAKKKSATANKKTAAAGSKKKLSKAKKKTPSVTNDVSNPTPQKVVETIEKSPIADSDMALVMEWIAAEVADAKIAYCYKQSFGRGVGETLSVCPPGTEKNGLLCYPKCREGFSGGGPVCWQNCPNGFRNDPAHCGKPKEYGRGTGYALHFGEFNLDGAMKRCRSENPQGCEQHGLLIYPKCKSGFHPVACCICSPDCPEGMNDIGVSCEKGSYGRGVGEPMICPPGLEQNGALCYEPCKEGYKGVGPVCWRKCPPNQPVDCGAGCAKSTADCVEKTVNQVTAVAEMALNIASMGSTSGFTAAKAGVKTSIKAGNKVAAKMYMKKAVKELAQGFQQLTTKKVTKKLKQKFKEDALEWVKNEYAAVQMKLIMQEEFTADDLRVLAGLDPTGAAQVVEAFWQPICSDPNPFPTLSKSYE